MPFKKVGKDDYTGPSGKHFNSAQVRLYYAHGEKFPGQEAKVKSSGLKSASYAQGGPVLGRTTDFLKTPDRFRESQYKQKTEDVFGKSDGDSDDGGAAVPATPKTKSLKAVKPKG